MEKCGCNAKAFTYFDMRQNCFITKCGLTAHRVDKSKKKLNWESTNKKPCTYSLRTPVSLSQESIESGMRALNLDHGDRFMKRGISNEERNRESIKEDMQRLGMCLKMVTVTPNWKTFNEIDILLRKFVPDWNRGFSFSTSEGVAAFYEKARNVYEDLLKNKDRLQYVHVQKKRDFNIQLYPKWFSDDIDNKVRAFEKNLQDYLKHPYVPKEDDLLAPLSPPEKKSTNLLKEKKDYEVFSDIEFSSEDESSADSTHDSYSSERGSDEEEEEEDGLDQEIEDDSESESSEIQDEYYE